MAISVSLGSRADSALALQHDWELQCNERHEHYCRTCSSTPNGLALALKFWSPRQGGLIRGAPFYVYVFFPLLVWTTDSPNASLTIPSAHPQNSGKSELLGKNRVRHVFVEIPGNHNQQREKNNQTRVFGPIDWLQEQETQPQTQPRLVILLLRWTKCQICLTWVGFEGFPQNLDGKV